MRVLRRTISKWLLSTFLYKCRGPLRGGPRSIFKNSSLLCIRDVYGGVPFVWGHGRHCLFIPPWPPWRIPKEPLGDLLHPPGDSTDLPRSSHPFSIFAIVTNQPSLPDPSRPYQTIQSPPGLRTLQNPIRPEPTLRPLEQVAQLRSPASGLPCQNPQNIMQKVV
jgi:hypothetical protein